MNIRARTTRYGLSPRASGWDYPGDSGTDNWMGCFGNKLNTSSCALTTSLEAELAQSLPSLPGLPDRRLLRDGNGQVIPGRIKPFTLLRVAFLAPFDKMVFYREFADRAPESDPRLDIFLPFKDDPSIPDYGLVSVV